MQAETPYNEAIARKYPEQVVIAIAKDASGKHNPISLGWTMITSGEPPMMAISVGLARHSLGAIRNAGEFVVCFPSSTMATEVLYFGTRSGRDEDKLTAFGAKTQPATKIDSLLLSDAAANFECVLESEMETGDHVIFVGRVVAAHVHKDPGVVRLYNLGDREFSALRPA